MAREYTVLVKSRFFSIENMPNWLYDFDHGSDFISGEIEIFIPENKIKKVKEYFKKKKIPIKII